MRAVVRGITPGTGTSGLCRTAYKLLSSPYCWRSHRLYSNSNNRSEQKDLILSVLRSTATKREARQYIARYNPRTSGSVFERGSNDPDVRIALIKVRNLGAFTQAETEGLGHTIRRLTKLGVSPIVILDAGIERTMYLSKSGRPFRHYQRLISRHAERVVRAIEKASPKTRARAADNLFEVSDKMCPFDATKDGLRLAFPHLLQTILFGGSVPVVTPIAYDSRAAEDKLVLADDLLLSLSKELTDATQSIATRASVEKVIFVDPLGGIPSSQRMQDDGKYKASHVYVNLEQEMQGICAELRSGTERLFLSKEESDTHLANLRAMQRCLSITPLSSTGIITTPEVAALGSSRNPIIYNILTDRPVISPSLPVDAKRTPMLRTTILRRGMPITSLKSPSPFEGLDLVKQDKIGAINLRRLWDLIEDSFGRKLDVEHYLNRVNGKVAGLIIAGDYQGAAIITWEHASNSHDHAVYLDKFAVKKSSQGGAGVADTIFKLMVMDMFPEEVIWRSRGNNPVNKWYFERSKGTMKVPGTNWVMFWTGTDTRESTRSLEEYVRICQAIEPSFKK